LLLLLDYTKVSNNNFTISTFAPIKYITPKHVNT
jgi:hypothetical protein